ncbi:hypothetical protein RVR_8246 [Actinacidiphila reveromycinica]|uniref:Uncharacterized protein n=1 Tax=Actinacidiphila reveromycinica TaxID=659352 RepID=A0A7U3VRT1_9ACTN|nr:hypothetical protein [Streptomyces sp. SN-593]BBB01015.1 hypothetical protein RVR_8246 [Streptomyces sp. SN-593]
MTANYPTSTETFGHEPFRYDGVPNCIRCYTERRGRRRPVPWPCTSAVVLGLVVVDADRWNARNPVGTPVCAYPLARPEHPAFTPDMRLTTATRTPAWRLGHGTSVVAVDGYPGGIALTHIDPIGGA